MFKIAAREGGFLVCDALNSITQQQVKGGVWEFWRALQVGWMKFAVSVPKDFLGGQAVCRAAGGSAAAGPGEQNRRPCQPAQAQQ